MGLTFGGLQGIYFAFFHPVRDLYMRGHAAGSQSPFDGGIREIDAVFLFGGLEHPLATFALLNDGMAITAIKLATALFHKTTFDTFFYCCTNHGYHVLSFNILTLNGTLCPKPP